MSEGPPLLLPVAPAPQQPGLVPPRPPWTASDPSLGRSCAGDPPREEVVTGKGRSGGTPTHAGTGTFIRVYFRSYKRYRFEMSAEDATISQVSGNIYYNVTLGAGQGCFRIAHSHVAPPHLQGPEPSCSRLCLS